MKPRSIVLAAAGLAFVVSFFLPVTKGSPAPLGYEAALASFKVLLFDEWDWSPIMITGKLSCLGNLALLAALIPLSRRWRLWIVPLIAAGALTAWLPLFFMSNLRVAYYVWAVSITLFVIAACIPRHWWPEA